MGNAKSSLHNQFSKVQAAFLLPYSTAQQKFGLFRLFAC